MYTWFDALLVTLLAIITALGVRRGLLGLLWGVVGVILAFVVNLVISDALLALLLALLASGGIMTGLVRLLPNFQDEVWHSWAGGVGGFLLGGLLMSALALNFPMDTQQTSLGLQAVYPSRELPAPLYTAVDQSVIKGKLMGVWNGNKVLQHLIVPDRLH